ncbi:hypothetical protein JTB14_010531 [Gonioctena quinquepunctata]|nr:hypothetical protein JTB14_010531 [Gonioctena quinquepunctata]
MEEKKEVGTMNQNGILESRQIGEKSETEGRFQEKEGNQLKKRKSLEIHNTKEGNEEVGEKEKMEKHDLGKEQRWETEILAEDDLDIPARTEVVLMGRLKKKICGKILVCESEEMGNAHFLVAKSVVKNGESVPIRLINLSQGQVKVQRNQKIALAAGCVEEEETEKESLRVQGVSLSNDKWIPEGFQMDHLTENIRKKLSELLLNYRDLFREDDDKLTTTTEVKHAMPKIACGLDGLSWEKVQAMIEFIFQNSNLEVIVYEYLVERMVIGQIEKEDMLEPEWDRDVLRKAQEQDEFCKFAREQLERVNEGENELYYLSKDGIVYRRDENVDKLMVPKENITTYEKVPLQKFTPTQEPWEFTSMDIVGPLVTSMNGNRYLLTFQDYFTKYTEVIPLPDQKADTIARAFVEQIIVRHGTPRKLLTDQGANFTSTLFKEVCKLLNIKKIQTSSYAPTSNGQIERMHRVLKEVYKNTEKAKEKRNKRFNRKTEEKVFALGELVYLKDMATRLGTSKKLVRTWIGPYRVIEKEGPVTYRIKKVGTRQEQVIHVNRLKPYYGEVKGKLPEEIWTGWKNTQEKSLKEKMGDEDEERLKERIRRKNRRKKQLETESENEEGEDPEWNPAVIPQGILIRREEEENDSEEDELEGGADNESEEEFLEEPMLRRSTRIRKPPDRYSP